MSTDIGTRRVYYVLSTHWDREWYEPFQFYRFRLVQLLDRVVDALEDGRLKGPFQMDGQAIILEDYLEVRPERRAQVERFVRERKLVVGPWYVLPDEFLVSGESHIRNIRLGREIARQYGSEPSNAGFVCDLFGHISQLPQIFNGFGIKSGFLWRGINLDTRRNLVWSGADGSELVCYKFANVGYCDYAFKVRDADKMQVEFDAEATEKKLDAYLKYEASETEVDPILIFDGGDHQEWDERTYQVFAKRFGTDSPEFSCHHTGLDEYVEELLAQSDRIVTHLQGELREPGKTPMKAGHQIHGVLSSRVWIKQWNQLCQDMLCHWAEPFAAFANESLGAVYPEGFLRVAWKHLLQNHPHDSICGCSVDTVHEDMKFRFSQCQQIAERLTLEASRKITASVDDMIHEKEVRVTVFNPLATPVRQMVDLALELPSDYPTFGEFFNFEMKPAFTVHGPDGEEIPYQRLGQAMQRLRTRIYDAKFPDAYKVNEVKVSLPLEIPALGYTTLTVRPGIANEPTRYPQDKGLATSARSMENENLAVSIESNGTLTLRDKQTGNVYTGLLAFEERADIGDGWFHGVALNDQIYVSTSSTADVALIENGPNVSAFRIRTIMWVPEEFDFASMRRSERRAEFIVDSVIRLRAGSDHLEVETRIDNNVKDHRVRVMFPTDAKVDTYVTDTPFDVVERVVPIRPDNHLYAELEVETRPQQNWCAITDGKRGLATASTGLMEVCVRDLDDRPIALTLFRGTRRTVLTDGEPNGQILGPLSFRYAIRPVGGSIDPVAMFQLSQKVANGLRAIQMRLPDQKIHRQATQLPASASFLEVNGGAILTSARHVDATLEARIFNPAAKSITAVVKLGQTAKKFRTAELVDLESKPVGKLTYENGTVRVPLTAKKIATIRFS